MTAVSPNRPMFDPKALLNPRAAPKRKADGPRGRSASPKGRDAVDDGHKVRGPDRMGSMIERIHNVGAREYAPHKRRKADEKQAADAEPAKKYTTFDGGSGSGSVLSDYVKKKQTEDDTVGAQASRIVDLTVDEDEEEGTEPNGR